MPWKKRGSNAYFYESRRINGRVVSRYRGAGEIGESAAERLQLRRDRLSEERAALRERRREERWHQADRDAWLDDVLGTVSEALRAAGYHRPDRGRWRKRRGASMATTISPATTSEARPLAETFERSPDFAVVRELLHKHWTQDERTKAVRDRWKEDTYALAASLAGPDPSPLVVMLAETVAVCWLELRGVQFAAAYNKTESFKAAEYLQKSVDRSHRRFLKASKALADVKRIDPPTLIQINQTVHQPPPNLTPHACQTVK